MQQPQPPSLPWRAPATWVRLAALAAAYVALAQLGLLFALPGQLASPIWPPTGLAIAAVALWGPRAVPAIAAAALGIEYVASDSWLASVGMGIGNTLEALVGGLLLRRLGGPAAFTRLRGIAGLALAALAAPVASATFGIASLVAIDTFPLAAAPQAWWTWYLGDAAGALVVAPVLLLASTTRLAWPRARTAIEAVSAVATLLVVAAALFGLVPGGGLAHAVLVVLLMPPLVWVGFRLGPRAGALAILLLDIMAVQVTRLGQGPFVAADPTTSFILLQVFVFTVGLLVLGLAALSSERRRAASELEHRVSERTHNLEDVNGRLAAEVAERRRAEADMMEAQRVAHMGTWNWDISKPNAVWSPELYRIYGLEPDRHVPSYEDYLTRVHPDDRDRVKAATDAVFRLQQPYSHDERIRRPDGSWRNLHTWAHAVTDKDGKLVALAGACQDVTDQHAAAAQLSESLERFRALAESSPIGIAHTTVAGSVDWANQTWSKITGIQDHHDDALVRNAIHPDDQPRSWQLWGEAARNGTPFQDDMRWVHPDGSIRATNCRAVPTHGPDGRITGFVTTVEDITDRRAAEDARLKEQEARMELRRAREQADFKTNFLRTAAHELGTPLTPLKIQLRVLRDLVHKRPDPEEARAVAILERNVDRLQVLVKDLLESARLQSGRLRLNPRSMDLAHIVHDVVETFQEPAIQTGVALDAHVPTEMAMVGDPDRITQVLYNLLSNAMKFTPPGGRVHVVAEDLGETVRLLVQDTGAGFDAQQASHLFQPFSQVHDVMQVSKPGSGLGLYICKGIVEQHGGGITAHSDGPGKGARFTVSLPRVARPPAPAANPFDAKVEHLPPH